MRTGHRESHHRPKRCLSDKAKSWKRVYRIGTRGKDGIGEKARSIDMERARGGYNSRYTRFVYLIATKRPAKHCVTFGIIRVTALYPPA